MRIKEKIETAGRRARRPEPKAVDAINAAVSPTGLSSDQQAKLDETLKARAEAERAVHDAFAKIDRKKYPQMYHNEVSSSNSVPLCDGRHVYWVCGGGMKGPGAHVIACFEPDGQRVLELARRGNARLDGTRQPHVAEPRRWPLDLCGQRHAHGPGRQDRQGVVAELPRRLAEHRPRQQFPAGRQDGRHQCHPADQVHSSGKRRYGDLPQQSGPLGRAHARRRERRDLQPLPLARLEGLRSRSSA